ncbi:H-NS family nucleoid-associated regulatory protein [Kosakonia radicincitans]|uniref:H-NS family histone-like protein n=1 Tax=Kosakonia radicincitans TaxID=283686 RepID=UPI0031D88BBD
MSEDLKNLNNIRILRAQARELPAEALEEILEKFTIVVEERREEETSQRKEIEEKRAKLEAFRAKLLEEGIDPSELISTIKTGQNKAKSKSPRSPRPAKYKYVDEDGNEKTWTGQGRTPRAIAKALEEGKKLEDFAI